MTNTNVLTFDSSTSSNMSFVIHMCFITVVLTFSIQTNLLTFYSSMIPTSYFYDKVRMQLTHAVPLTMSPSTSYRHQTSSSFPLTRLDHLRGLR